jgi:hypothetical protein
MMIGFDKNTQVARLLAYVTGVVDQQLLAPRRVSGCGKQNAPESFTGY